MRATTMRGLLGLAAIALLAGGLAGCAPGGPDDTVERDVATALKDSDLGIADADADLADSGTSVTLTVLVAIDADSVDSSLLRGILETTVKTIGDGGRVDVLSVGVSQGSIDDGDPLPLDAASAELGFAPQPSGSPTAFDETVAAVTKTLGL